MRFFVISDVHAEFSSAAEIAARIGPIPECDAVIAAGDMDHAKRVPATLQTLFGPRPVYAVHGNHEFYGAAINVAETDPKGLLREAARRGHYAASTAHHVVEAPEGPIHLIMATLWTGFDVVDPSGPSPKKRPVYAEICRKRLPDFGLIKVRKTDGAYRAFHPKDALDRHKDHRAFIRDQLDALTPAERARTIIVTHHLPIPELIVAKHRGGPVTAAFSADLRDVLAGREPAVWICGHDHQCRDVRHHGVRFVSNALGFEGEPTGYQPGFTIEM